MGPWGADLGLDWWVRRGGTEGGRARGGSRSISEAVESDAALDCPEGGSIMERAGWREHFEGSSMPGLGIGRKFLGGDDYAADEDDGVAMGGGGDEFEAGSARRSIDDKDDDGIFDDVSPLACFLSLHDGCTCLGGCPCSVPGVAGGGGCRRGGGIRHHHYRHSRRRRGGRREREGEGEDSFVILNRRRRNVMPSMVLLACMALGVLCSGAAAQGFWTAVVPQTAVIARPTTLNITGSGMSVGASDYTCRFSTSIIDPLLGSYVSRTVAATVVTPSLAQCETPPESAWGLPAATTTLRLYKAGSPVTKKGTAATVSFLAVAHSVTPTLGRASGGDAVVVSGYGFDPLSTTPYSVWLKLGGIEVQSEACTVREGSYTTLDCVTPAWPSSATNETVLVVRQGIVSVVSESPLGYALTPSCDSYSALSSLAETGGSFMARGHGFIPGQEAGCRFFLDDGSSLFNSTAQLMHPNESSYLCMSPTRDVGCAAASPSCTHNASLEVHAGGALICGPVQFSFLSSWNESSIVEGLASGGYALAVQGLSFDTNSSDYALEMTCREDGRVRVSSRVAPLSSNVISFKVPGIESLPCTASVRVLEGKDAMQGPPNASNFMYRPSWQTVSALSAPAIGGLSLTVYGAFDALDAYDCAFDAAPHNGTMRRTSPATLSSPSSLTCLSPAWESSGGTADFSVLDSAGNALSRDPPAVATFEFSGTYWTSTSPTSATVAGEIKLTIRGVFDADSSNYSCRLDAGVDSRVGTVDPGTVTATSIVCVIPEWQPYIAASATLTVLSGTSALARSGIALPFVVQPLWSGLSLPRGLSTGNDTVILHGSGLSERDKYTCMFCAAEGCLTSPGTYIDDVSISCVTPAWSYLGGNATVRLTSTFDEVPFGCPSGGDSCIQSGYAQNLFEFLPVAQGFAPKLVPAIGGLPITVRGVGFGAPVECTCAISSDGNEVVVSAEALSSTALVCANATWNSTDPLAQLSLTCGGRPVSTDSGAQTAVHIAFNYLTAVDPVSGPASGNVSIDVRGANLCGGTPSCDASAYACAFFFTREGVNGTLNVTSRVSSVMDDVATCTLPSWDYESPANVIVSLIDVELQVNGITDFARTLSLSFSPREILFAFLPCR